MKTMNLLKRCWSEYRHQQTSTRHVRKNHFHVQEENIKKREWHVYGRADNTNKTLRTPWSSCITVWRNFQKRAVRYRIQQMVREEWRTHITVCTENVQPANRYEWVPRSSTPSLFHGFIAVFYKYIIDDPNRWCKYSKFCGYWWTQQGLCRRFRDEV